MAETYSRDKSVTVLGNYFGHIEAYNNYLGWEGSSPLRAKVQRTLDGYKNPMWKKQVAALENATTNATGRYTWCEWTDGYFWYRHYDVDQTSRKVRQSVRGCLLGSEFFNKVQNWWTPGVDTEADNRARIAFYKRLRAAQVAFSGPTFLGELKETIHMLRSPAMGLRELANKWVRSVTDRKRWHRPNRQWKKNLSSAWLEQAFGWQPLIADINNAYEAYKSVLKPKVAYISGFGLGDEKDVSSANGYNNYETWLPLVVEGVDRGAGRLLVRKNARATEQTFVKYQGCIKRTSVGAQTDALTHFGFTPSEFVPTAWELLPWSFLVDYFTNIGDVLSAWVTSTSEIAWSNKSVVTSLTYRMTSEPSWTKIKQARPTTYAYDGDGSTGKAGQSRWQRFANTGVGLPTVSLELPGKPAQWANMLALFTQANSFSPQRYRWH